MRFWFRKRHKCGTLQLVEEYRRGPWKWESIYEYPDPPYMDIVRHIDGKWGCPDCGKTVIWVKRQHYDARFGFDKLLSEPHVL